MGFRSVALKRRLAIADLVRKEGEVRVEDLSGRLNVSAVTIRSDLTYLEHEGLVTRRFGKAVAQARNSAADPYQETLPDKAHYRDLLLVAADLLQGEQTILTGLGSLPLQLIPHLGTIPDLSLTVSSLESVALARNCTDADIYVLGGRLDPDGSTMSGTKALQRLRHEMNGAYVFEAEAIVSARQVDGGTSFVFGNQDEASFAATACEYSSRSVALVRSGFAGSDTGSFHRHLDAVHDLVFPSAPSSACAEALARAGYVGRAVDGRVAVVYSRSSPADVP
jgi:DeoR/GlpR family transcriptional regulator of sugar metabolism